MNLTNTTWTFNDSLTLPSGSGGWDFSVNYEILYNEQVYTSTSLSVWDEGMWYTGFDPNGGGDGKVYDEHSNWLINAKVIHILNGTDVSNSDLISFLTANAAFTPVLADVIGLEDSLVQIADLIRAKGHTTEDLGFPQGFTDAIGVLAPIYYSGTVSAHFINPGSVTVGNLYDSTHPATPSSAVLVAASSAVFPCDVSANVCVRFGAIVTLTPTEETLFVEENTSGTQTNVILETSSTNPAAMTMSVYGDSFAASITAY